MTARKELNRIHRIRYAKIVEDRRSGMTLKAVGNKYGISAERVRQIVEQYGK